MNIAMDCYARTHNHTNKRQDMCQTLRPRQEGTLFFAHAPTVYSVVTTKWSKLNSCGGFTSGCANQCSALLFPGTQAALPSYIRSQ
jgi:hypothetical protein